MQTCSCVVGNFELTPIKYCIFKEAMVIITEEKPAMTYDTLLYPLVFETK